MTTTWLILLVIGVLIIVGLAFYAGKLLWQVKEQKQALATAKAQYEAQKAARNAKLADSIHLITKAMKEKQCEYSEGCLRVWVLMSQYHFEPEKDLANHYPAIFAMYEVVKDLPTHEARKKYSKKEIFQQDTRRWRAEQELEPKIQQDIEKLLTDFAPQSDNQHVFM